MVEKKLIWPPSLTDDLGPKAVLQSQVEELQRRRPGLEPKVTAERKGENLPDGHETRRVDLCVRISGRQVELATVEFPVTGPGYPALVITGDSPHWRYNHAYDSDELVDVLKHELSRDGRLAA